MSELLSLTIMVDADRYRFSRLVMETVVELGGNEFCAIARLNRFIESVRAGLQAGDSLLKGELRLEQDRLMACCSNGEAVLLCDVVMPGINDVAALVKRLKQKSEQLDPDLLRRSLRPALKFHVARIGIADGIQRHLPHRLRFRIGRPHDAHPLLVRAEDDDLLTRARLGSLGADQVGLRLSNCTRDPGRESRPGEGFAVERVSGPDLRGR